MPPAFGAPLPSESPCHRPRTPIPPTGGLDRAALLLDAFDGPGRLNLAQVVRRTGLSRSSAHRMLERLVQLHWLRRDGRDYELGMRLFELGSLALHQDRLHQAALPYLHELHRLTGHVVHLAVLDGVDVVYLDKIGPGFGARLPSRIGGRQPAHCTSVGKALLANLAPSERECFLATDLRGSTQRSPAVPSRLRTELARIRERGIAVDAPGIGGRDRLHRRAGRQSGQCRGRTVRVRSGCAHEARAHAGDPAPDRGARHHPSARRSRERHAMPTIRPQPARPA